MQLLGLCRCAKNEYNRNGNKKETATFSHAGLEGSSRSCKWAEYQHDCNLTWVNESYPGWLGWTGNGETFISSPWDKHLSVVLEVIGESEAPVQVVMHTLFDSLDLSGHCDIVPHRLNPSWVALISVRWTIIHQQQVFSRNIYHFSQTDKVTVGNPLGVTTIYHN